MDLEKFRSQWDDPEFEQSFARLDQEPTSAIVQRLKSMDERARRWRGARRIIPRALLLVSLVAAALRHFVAGIPDEAPLQTAAFMLGLAVLFVLQLLEKAREEYELPKLWLDHREFLLDEHRRIGRNIRFDQWTSALVCTAIACAALYVARFLSAALQIAFLAAAGAAAIAFWFFDRRRISQLKRSRNAPPDLPEDQRETQRP